MPRKKNGPRSIKRDRPVEPEVESPSEAGPANDAAYALNRPEGTAESERGTWGQDPSRPERRAEPRGAAGSAGGPRLRRKTDDSLASEIHEILTSDPELDAREIEVLVEGGAVTLNGEVEHPDAKLLAEELTESVAGVRLVHNRLVVRR